MALDQMVRASSDTSEKAIMVEVLRVYGVCHRLSVYVSLKFLCGNPSGMVFKVESFGRDLSTMRTRRQTP